jgi:hypothetical protein
MILGRNETCWQWRALRVLIARTVSLMKPYFFPYAGYSSAEELAMPHRIELQAAAQTVVRSQILMSAPSVNGRIGAGRPAWRERASSVVLPSIVFVALCAAFWILRIYYWKTNIEAPFSDMADYVAVADNILESFTFGHPRGPTFHTPVTPSLIVISKLISAVHFHSVFQFLTQLLAFVGVLALAREIRLLTGQTFLALALLGIVAICRPSIFWSLKISTEPVCEALLYVTSALTLTTLRTQRLSLSLAAGMCCLLLGLNRPNYLPGILLVFLAILVRARTVQLSDAERSKSWRSLRIFGLTLGLRQMALPALFLCGFLGLWSPWIARNYINYGVFLPTSSSGYLSVISEQGGAPIRIGRYESLKLADGSEFSNFGTGNLFEVWQKLPTPVERSRFTQMLASAWLAENWTDIPRATLWRLRHMMLNRGADGLTKLSREDLFRSPSMGAQFPYQDPAWINVLLLDKTPTACLLSLVGLIFLLVRFPCAGLALTGLLFVPWIAAAAVIGAVRPVESLIAVDIWLAFFGVSTFVGDMLGKPIGPAKIPDAGEKAEPSMVK